MCNVHVNDKLSALQNPPCVPCKAARTSHTCHLSACAAHCCHTIRCPFPILNTSKLLEIIVVHYYVAFCIMWGTLQKHYMDTSHGNTISMASGHQRLPH